MNLLSPTYAESVYQQLRDEILTGKRRPGDRIAETEVAQQMGTSQGPVREAFTRLREQGLLISFRHRGSYVSEISIDEARDAYAIRAVLEREAMRLALPRMGERDFEVLEKDIRAMEAATGSGDMAGNLERDMEFHRRIFEWSNSPTLLQCWDIIEMKIRKFAIIASPSLFEDLLRPVRSHYELIEHMRAGYSPELEAELDRHLDALWVREQALAEDSA
jgi:DNA-binding GntR family transcriptional regulator